MRRNNISRKARKSQSNQDRPSNHKTSGKTWLKRILLGIFLFLVLLVVAGCSLFTYYAATAPELTEEDLYGNYASDLVDKDGEVFYTLGGENREHAEFEEYPDVLLDAVMAIEDQRFLEHNGIDPIGIGRAAVGYLSEGEIVGGGSTITQQLVKLSVFSTSREDQTLKRKAQEAWLAFQVEQELSKEEIMTLYLNKVHMGGNIYGMATGAEEYYGKHVSDLELHEAAMLAGMPKAPNYYNPFVEPQAAKNRRDTVIYAMADAGFISEEEANQAYQVPLEEGLQEPSPPDEDSLIYDGYITAVLSEIEEKTDYDPYTAGLTIHTNLDREKQHDLYEITHNQREVSFPDEELQTAVTLINNETGAIDAMIGSRNIEGHLSENFALDMTRNVGSTIKPLTTYGPAIEFLEYSTYHQVVDEPYTVPNTDWEPRNWDREYMGQISIREALVRSRNIPTAKIFNEDLDNAQVEQFLTELGIDPKTVAAGSETLVPSNAIDGIMAPVDLAGAYSAFARYGEYTEPYTVEYITTSDGEEEQLSPESTQAMTDATAYMITDILKDVVTEEYPNSLDIPGVHQAGKTGTTNYSDDDHETYNIPSDGVPDSWYVGYTQEYTMSTWVGYEDQFEEGHYLTNEAGTRQLPRNIFQTMFTEIYQDQESEDWEMPDSVVEYDIIDGTVPPEVATASTPSSQVVTELFVEGNTPEDQANGFFGLFNNNRNQGDDNEDQGNSSNQNIEQDSSGSDQPSPSQQPSSPDTTGDGEEDTSPARPVAPPTQDSPDEENEGEAPGSEPTPEESDQPETDSQPSSPSQPDPDPEPSPEPESDSEPTPDPEPRPQPAPSPETNNGASSSGNNSGSSNDSTPQRNEQGGQNTQEPSTPERQTSPRSLDTPEENGSGNENSTSEEPPAEE